MRPVMAKKIRGMETTDFKPLPEDLNAFPGVVKALGNITGAAALNEVLEGAATSEVLSKELKVLMFAVVARALQCEFCQTETRKMAHSLGFADSEFDHAINTLSSPRLDETETLLLNWTRETIHYEAGPIQAKVKSLALEIDPEIMVEAIGIAALANTVVRLAILLE